MLLPNSGSSWEAPWKYPYIITLRRSQTCALLPAQNGLEHRLYVRQECAAFQVRHRWWRTIGVVRYPLNDEPPVCRYRYDSIEEGLMRAAVLRELALQPDRIADRIEPLSRRPEAKMKLEQLFGDGIPGAVHLAADLCQRAAPPVSTLDAEAR